MKKVYLVYAKIPAILFDAKLYDLVPNKSNFVLSNGYYIGLYGWTNKKILLDSFIEFRKDASKMYNIIKRKFTKDEFIIFRKENFHSEMLYYRVPSRIDYDDNFSIGWIPTKDDTELDKTEFFSTHDKASQIVCTRTEFENVFEYGEQYLYEYMNQIINTDYIIFKDKYKQLLDYIGYVDLFNTIHDGGVETEYEDSFYSDRYLTTQGNKAYNRTYYGNMAVDIFDNKLALFVNIYYEMIVGYKVGSNIKLLIYK